MGNLIQVTPVATQVKTENGEVTVNINLNLSFKLDSESLSTATKDPELSESVFKKEKIKFEKPDFADNSEIINFGKQI